MDGRELDAHGLRLAVVGEHGNAIPLGSKLTLLDDPIESCYRRSIELVVVGIGERGLSLVGAGIGLGCVGEHGSAWVASRSGSYCSGDRLLGSVVGILRITDPSERNGLLLNGIDLIDIERVVACVQ